MIYFIEEQICGGKETLVYSIARWPEDVDKVTLMAVESFANSTPTKEIDAIDDPSANGLKRFDGHRTRTRKAFVVREKSTKK